jgi:UTP:GlnB (protein PII) uridylyltransferase
VDVVRLEEQTYHLRIFCQRGPGVLVQLVQAVESLGVQVLNAHHTAFQENILNSFIAEVCMKCTVISSSIPLLSSSLVGSNFFSCAYFFTR